jgi:acyl-CoA synthetase (AMP-forming)/AMP-acid ligase II
MDTRTLDTATLDTATLDTATLDTATLDTATLDTATLDTATLDTATLDASVLAAFSRLVARAPDTPLFTFVDDGGNDEQTVTAAGLAASAESIAGMLRRWGLRPGDRAVLVYPPSADFVRALVGCLVAGVIPVPVYPPNPFRLKHEIAGFAAIVASSGAGVALTNASYDRARTLGAATGRLRREGGGWPALRWHRTDRRAGRPEGVPWHQPAGPDEPALLQYTSGSTAAPRGVTISHRNLTHEIAANAADLGLGPDTRGVFWLPQYHDFGLISVILSTLAGNSHTYLMSPLTFLQRPAVWFEVMSRVRATHTAAPNFAFEVAVRKTTPEQRARWDLRPLRVVMSAAEPIRPLTVGNFYAAFAPAGLRPDSFYPAYGLAEHTVSVSMGGRARLLLDGPALQQRRVEPGAAGSADVVEYLGCGRVSKPGTRVRIVDPDTLRPAPPGRVGEIWVDSPTKALGYYGDPEESRRTFRARIDDPADHTEYLRTGDLGFFHDEELFITGRLKDVIILNGRNHYPADLEDAVRDCHPLVRPGGLAAFGVEAAAGEPPGERLVLFVETHADRLSPAGAEEVAQAVRQALYGACGLACPVVVVGRAGLVRKTTSGKVRRGACRAAFLSGIGQDPKTFAVSVQARPVEEPRTAAALVGEQLTATAPVEELAAAGTHVAEPVTGDVAA